MKNYYTKIGDYKETFDEFAGALHVLATELTPGQVTELIEYACEEQSNWRINSTGWKVFEAFKEYVRDVTNG